MGLHSLSSAPLRLGPDGRVARIPTPTGLGVGDIHSYVILPASPSDGPVLVDTGVRGDASWSALEAGFAALGLAVKDVSRVLLTHAHPDHFGHAARVAREAGCEVWAHEGAQVGIDRYALPPPDGRLERLAHFWEWLGVPPERARGSFGPPSGTPIVEHVVPDRRLRDGDRVELPDFPLDVIHVPGHCPDQIVYWQAGSRCLLAGDHLLPDITPVCLIDIPEEGAERAHTLAQFHESLDRVEPLPIRLALPSHGDPIERHRDLIARYRLHTAQRKLKMARLLSRGDATPFELAKAMFPKVWDAQLHLVLSEVMGHLDLLERDECARSEERGGVVHYVFVALPEVA